MVFEAGEFAVYSNESSVPENQGTMNFEEVTELRLQSEAKLIQIHHPKWDPFQIQRVRRSRAAGDLRVSGFQTYCPGWMSGFDDGDDQNWISCGGNFREITSPPISTLPRKSNLE